MKSEKQHTVVEIFIQIIIFEILGIIFIGSYVARPDNTLFSFTLYGTAAILFYYLIIKAGFYKFLFFGTLITIFILVTTKMNSEILVNIRNILWFVLIGVLAVSIAHFENNNWYKRSRLIPIGVWCIGFILIYQVMIFLNNYVFGFYKINERWSYSFYILQAIKIGGILGFGIGLGKIIIDFLFLNPAKTTKPV